MTTVVVGGTGTLLCELVSEMVTGQGFKAHENLASTPQRLEIAVRGVAAATARQVVTLVDPQAPEWEKTAKKLRSADPRLGLIVLTTRPSYLLQRTWQQPLSDRRSLANGLLSFDSLAADVADAIEAARRRPQSRSGFWLDGARHPFAFHQTDAGRAADVVRKKPELHRTLVLEGEGLSRTSIGTPIGDQSRHSGRAVKQAARPARGQE